MRRNYNLDRLESVETFITNKRGKFNGTTY